MTSCSECLTALSSARISDIAPGSTIAVHCATCPQCLRVADEVRYAEYRLAASLNEERPGLPSDQVAIAAIDGSELYRRRYIARWVRGGLALIALGIFGAAMEARRGGEGPGGRVTETILLRCLTAKQASELVTPYLRSNGSVVYHSDDLRTITIRSNREEFVAATMVLDKFDNAASCETPASTAGSLPAPVAVGPNPTFFEFQVDKPVAQIAGSGSPQYPVALRAAGVEGEVQAQFVVNMEGKAEPTTFKVLTATNDLFPAAVRSALPEMRFRPAEVRGKAVNQLVQQSFRFKLRE